MKKKRPVTIDEIIKRVEGLDHGDLMIAMNRILRLNFGPIVKREIVKIIFGGTEERPIADITITGTDRAIPAQHLRDLANSELMDKVEPLIKAAMSPRGPFQTRELMLEAVVMANKPLFQTHDFKDMKLKTQIGYVLTIAGFERRSHHDQETKRIIKAWKPVRGSSAMNADNRAEQVREVLKEYTGPYKKPSPPKTLEDLI